MFESSLRTAHRIVARRLREHNRLLGEAIKIRRDDRLLSQKPHGRPSHLIRENENQIGLLRSVLSGGTRLLSIVR